MTKIQTQKLKKMRKRADGLGREAKRLREKVHNLEANGRTLHNIANKRENRYNGCNVDPLSSW